MSIQLKASVTKAIIQLESSSWFSRCGSPLELDKEMNCELIRSFEIAIHESQSLRWIEVLNDADTVDMMQLVKAGISGVSQTLKELWRISDKLVSVKLNEHVLGRKLLISRRGLWYHV